MCTNNYITFVQQKAVQELLVPHHICQTDLSYILELRRQRDTIDEQIKESETAIRTALEVGAIVEPGIFQAYLKHTERRSVAWRVVVERELGEGYAARVLAATKTDKYCSLVISA
jgi:hypothetical protein